MSSFSCPYIDSKVDGCLRLDRACVPGRPGCVLPRDTAFVFSLEERMRDRDAEWEAARNSQCTPKR